MAVSTQKIWFITGISSGLGKALADYVLTRGDFVIGTFRQAEQVGLFNQQQSGRGFAYQLDLTDTTQIRTVAAEAVTQFGRVDVLVNNAGYGLAGAVEETSDEELRAIFETNFFGTVALTQALLPQFRQQRSGHIIQLSSHSGFKGFPGFGVYGASKFALEGISEALAAEVAPLNINVTIVEPGPFRTDFAGRSFQQTQATIADYADTAGAFRNRMAAVNGQQEGNPNKAAEAIYQLTTVDSPPLRLPLGKIALGTIRSKLVSVQQDVDNWQTVAENAVY